MPIRVGCTQRLAVPREKGSSLRWIRTQVAPLCVDHYATRTPVISNNKNNVNDNKIRIVFHSSPVFCDLQTIFSSVCHKPTAYLVPLLSKLCFTSSNCCRPAHMLLLLPPEGKNQTKGWSSRPGIDALRLKNYSVNGLQ